MSNYEDQYYFIRRPKFQDQLPDLQSNATTSMRNYATEAEPLGSAPLVFHNAWKEENIAEGIRETIADIMFEGSAMVVKTKIREALLAYEIPNLHMHPAIYIDDRDKWHEDYWYMTFTQRFDCWDKKKSVVSKSPPIVDDDTGMAFYGVRKYVLDKEMFDKMPIEKRLLFKMGGALDAFVTVHESLRRVFIGEGQSGAEFQRVSEFGST